MFVFAFRSMLAGLIVVSTVGLSGKNSAMGQWGRSSNQRIDVPPSQRPGRMPPAPRPKPNNQIDVGRDIVGPILKGVIDGAARQQRMQQQRIRPDHDHYPRVVPQTNNYYYPQPNYVQPQPPAKEEKPDAPVPTKVKEEEEKEVEPELNPISLRGRSITKAELERGLSSISSVHDDSLSEIEDKLDEALIDEKKLLAEMNAKGIKPDDQDKLLQYFREGDTSRFQIAWSAAGGNAADAVAIADKMAVGNELDDLRTKAKEGKLTVGDLRDFEKTVAGLPLGKQNKAAITKTLGQMQTTVAVSELLQNALGTPQATMVDLPPGVVPTIYNPNLPAGEVISLGNGSIMVGTGGQGELEAGSSSAAEAKGIPVLSKPPVMSSSKKIDKNTIRLVNPAEIETTVFYKVSGEEYETAEEDSELPPGEIHEFSDLDSLDIDFNKGGDCGRQQYELDPGTYKFVATDDGWDLLQQEYEITIDNGGNANPFRCVVDNEHVTIGPGQMKTFTSSHPVSINYSRGAIGAIKRTRLEAGSYRVALSATDGQWDLFPADGNETAAPVVPDFKPAF